MGASIDYMTGCPPVAVLARSRARRARHSDDFCLSEEVAGQYFDQFEVPTQDEGPLTSLAGTHSGADGESVDDEHSAG